MSQQEYRQTQYATSTIVRGAVVRHAGLKPEEVTNWTNLGQHFEQIVRDVQIELGAVTTLDRTFSAETTVAELIGAFS